MLLTLPHDKVSDLITTLQEFPSRSRASLHQLQQLAGKLNYACQVVRGGRTYLRRVLNILAPLKRPHHKVKLPGEFYLDIDWWLSFLPTFNGVSAITPDREFHILMDSSTVGAGIAFNHDWIYCNWKRDWPSFKDAHINYKETLSAYIAARKWAPLWAHSSVVFHTDSSTAKSILNKGGTKKNQVMVVMRQLFWLSAQYDFKISAIHVPGRFHHLPDAISRLHEPGHALVARQLLDAQCNQPGLCRHNGLWGHVSPASAQFLTDIRSAG